MKRLIVYGRWDTSSTDETQFQTYAVDGDSAIKLLTAFIIKRYWLEIAIVQDRVALFDIEAALTDIATNIADMLRFAQRLAASFGEYARTEVDISTTIRSRTSSSNAKERVFHHVLIGDLS